MESTTCTLLEKPKLHYWENECSSVRRRAGTWRHVYNTNISEPTPNTSIFFILQILYNSCIVNMLILNEYLKCQILDIKGEESPQFFPLKTHLM